jgi:hypothetical protein
VTVPEAGSRVICTIATGDHAALWELAEPGVHRYAVRHGYQVVHRDRTPDLHGRPVPWAKLPLIVELLEDHDLVVWLDADVVVVDDGDDIARDARGRRPVHAVAHRVGRVHVPNSGVLVVRRSPSARHLLEHAWHRSEWIHHRWWENAALIDVLGGDGDRGLVTSRQRRRASRRVGWLPRRWNSLSVDGDPDPAFVHFAGLPFEERLAGMRRLVAEVQDRESNRRAGVRPENTAPKLPSTSTTTCVARLA